MKSTPEARKPAGLRGVYVPWRSGVNQGFSHPRRSLQGEPSTVSICSFTLPEMGDSNDIPLAVHNIGGGVGKYLRHKILVKFLVRVWGNVSVGHALLLQTILDKGELLLPFPEVGARADEVDIAAFITSAIK